MTRSTRTLMIFAALAWGCGESEAEAPPAPSCVDTLADGGCRPCAWGSTLAQGGSCVPAGVPPDGCAEGFVHDGDRGCAAVMPPQRCAPGQWAVPGESACRALTPCGAAPWGEIPRDAATEHVDVAYVGGGSDGSEARPWTSVQAAVDAAAPGAVIALAAGSYEESVDIAKPVRLWGRCPELVEISGATFALSILPGASGAEVRDVAVRSTGVGIGISGATGVVAERVWVHGTGAFGIEVSNALGPASLHLAWSLLEDNGVSALVGFGSEVTVEHTVARAARPDAAGDFGRGVEAFDGEDGAPGRLVLRRVVVEDLPDVGVLVDSSTASIDALLVRSTLRGISVQRGADLGVEAVLELSGSVIEDHLGTGIYLSGSRATIERTTVRRAAPMGEEGRGLSVQSEGDLAATLALGRSLVEDSRQVGVFVQGSHATIDATAIRWTDATVDDGSDGGHPTTGHGGMGIMARSDDAGVSSEVAVTAALIEGATAAGVIYLGSSGSIVESAIRSMRASRPGQGVGVAVERSADGAAAASLALARSLVEGTLGGGVYIYGGTATVEQSIIRDSQPQLSGLYGDGIAVGFGRGEDASLLLDGSRVERSVRAALSAYGARVEVRGTALLCQAFDMSAEPAPEDGRPAALVDLGGNACGCPEPTQSCAAVNAGLAPPSPVDPG